MLDDTAEVISLDKAVKQCDVINLLRVQFERHREKLEMDEAEYLSRYGMTIEREKRMKDKAIIIHPAPINRGIEIESEVAECEKSRIFKQMTNGVFVRMAVISMVLEDKL